MHRSLTTIPAAAALAALLFAAAPADAGRGFLARQPLHRVPGTGETDARGGFSAWLRVRSDHSVVQGISVWFRGLVDAEGATLYMAKPGDAEPTEVGAFAVSDNGSGHWAIELNSNREDNPALPLGVENVLKLARGRIHVRIPSGEEADTTVLQAVIGDFGFRDLDLGAGAAGEKSRAVALRQAPPPGIAPDEVAAGKARIFRKRPRGSTSEGYEGLQVFASGLTEDGGYDVWIEDGVGDLRFVGTGDATPEGLFFFSLDSRAGDAIPSDLDAEDVRGLGGRRLEVRRSGFDEYSLAAVLPRLR